MYSKIIGISLCYHVYLIYTYHWNEMEWIIGIYIPMKCLWYSNDMSWTVAKSCTTKRMVKRQTKSSDLAHLSTGDSDFAPSTMCRIHILIGPLYSNDIPMIFVYIIIHIIRGLVNVPFWGLVSHHQQQTCVGDDIPKNSWVMWNLTGHRNPNPCILHFLSVYYYWLVVWLPFFIFPYIGNNHPKWLIFFRGVQTTNQITIYSIPVAISMVAPPLDPGLDPGLRSWSSDPGRSTKGRVFVFFAH